MKFAQVPLEWALNGFGMQKKKGKRWWGRVGWK